MMHQPSKARRKVVPAPTANGADSGEKLDQLLLSSAICNGEDIGPFVRKAFASGKPETLLQHLRHFSRSKESEIEEVCKAHYQDFILAVDDLRSLLSDVESLKSALSMSNSRLQSVAQPLLASLDSFVEATIVSQNVNLALSSVRTCLNLIEICSRANSHLSSGNFYMALKCVDLIESELLDKTPSSTIKRMLERKIPEIRSHIERKINKEFGDWLVEIRFVSRNLGQVAIGQASAGRQRDEELRMKQRQAEEQSRLSLRDCVYALDEEEEDEDLSSGFAEDGGDGYIQGNGGTTSLGFDLTPLYRAYHIHQTLDVEQKFKQYYFENRRLQLTSDFQVSSMTPFLESHQTFFSQIAGFFIVEDRVLRTGGGLITKFEVENLWETAVNYVSLLGVTLRRYGYSVDALLEVLSKHRDKYHELLLSDCSKQITEALAADKFDQMLMKKEYEYSMNDSVSFMSYGGHLDFYDVIKKYLDRLLGEVLDGALLKLISTSIHGVSQAMQLSGLPLRMVERTKRKFPLTNSRNAAEEMLASLLKNKVDGFLILLENVEWMADEPWKIVGALVDDSVKRFNVNALTGLDVDIRLLESFADNLSPLVAEADAGQLKLSLAEARQLVNLLLSNNPETFLNPVIRERSYNLLDYRKVVTVSEKLRDPSERLFGTFGGRGAKQNPKKKSLDTLIKKAPGC
ncbi:unnamed protein product [Rhodiola kirilowii]